MSLNHREQHQLYRIESRLRRSEPHLAAMLGVFGRLSADQRLPAWEQVTSRRDRAGRAVAQIERAVAVLAAAAIVLAMGILALVTAAFSGRRPGPPTPKPEGAVRSRETGDSQNPADRA